MLSRRLFLTALLAAPGSAWMVEAAGAQGKGASNGGGGGGSNAGGGGNGARSGNSNAGGIGNGGNSTQPVEQPSAVPEYTTTTPGPLRVRHRNGFEEEIGAGRYKMLDNRGRLVVNRVVRSSDYVRLRRLTGE